MKVLHAYLYKNAPYQTEGTRLHIKEIYSGARQWVGLPLLITVTEERIASIEVGFRF